MHYSHKINLKLIKIINYSFLFLLMSFINLTLLPFFYYFIGTQFSSIYFRSFNGKYLFYEEQYE
jgi:hypothetical protein